MNLKIATMLSILFEPAVLLAVSFVFSAIACGLSVTAGVLWMIALMSPIVLFRLWAKYAQGLDWDMRERSARTKPFIFLLIYLVFVGFALRFFEPRLLSIFSLFLVWSTGFFIITILWTKISGHVGGDMLAIGMILRYFGFVWWPLLCIIPLVAWARVVRKDHTLFQVVLGCIYSIAVLQFV